MDEQGQEGNTREDSWQTVTGQRVPVEIRQSRLLTDG
jgi:hypothetical protein